MHLSRDLALSLPELHCQICTGAGTPEEMGQLAGVFSLHEARRTLPAVMGHDENCETVPENCCGGKHG